MDPYCRLEENSMAQLTHITQFELKILKSFPLKELYKTFPIYLTK